jgi:primosomal protein N' (replication factor Y)
LVVGTRAAVFAPVRDPVLAIVDDEDHSGHKEERAPRYLTAAAAAERTRAHGILVIGATTPSVATYAGMVEGRLRLVAVPSPRPRIGVVDLRRRADAAAPLSRPVIDAVRRVVRRGGRVIVLRDRKGYASGLHCLECGSVERCPRCAVAMPYDRADRRLRCGICGTTAPAPAVCSTCGAPRLAPLGAGTERIAVALHRLTRNLWRFESRGASARTAEAILAQLRVNGGVVVATQVVVPYIEALRPDLVAVAFADRMLHRPEYRAAERALALLRTIGMAARTTVLVETTDPAHPAIRAMLASSLKPFYEDELAQRRALGYPPARSLLRVTITARSAALLEAMGARLAAASSPAVDVLGPTPRLERAGRAATRDGDDRGKTAGVRYEFVIKAADRGAARALVLPLLIGAGRGVEVTVDVDPHEL